MFFGWEMDKQPVVHPWKKEQTIDTCNNMGEFQITLC